ncbi:proteinase-activated receptor 1-like [Erpetoichthys calabaricus]|uniref:Proteinase-activated receptor 1 n=1 Tax=Erpetoichthys calabaricus TaxID=27687 RepID=A0A8C4RUX4_ERPCA|nr:proteinase-activated receptor 1-like [Erpetoichthys calabaricus]
MRTSAMQWQPWLILCVAVISAVASEQLEGPRGFPSFYSDVTDEPIDYLDVLNHKDEGSGSGMGVPEVRVSRKQNHSKMFITQTTKEYLTGRWMTLFIPSVYTMVFVASLLLNGLAILMFIFKVKLTKPAVIYMLNLAFADLLFILLLPFKISYHFSGNNWTYGPVMCRIVTAAFYCNMYCSVLLVMCIAIDRFLAVVYPMQSLSWRSRENAIIVCVSMWFLSVGGVMPILLSEQTARIPDLSITTCHDVLDIKQFQGYYLYFFPIFCFVFFFIPMIVTSVCYIRIIQCLGSTNVASKCRKTRAIFMAVVVFTIFIVCFAPTNIILLTHYLRFANGYNENSYFAYLISMCLGSISCTLDPLIYYFGSSTCQRHLHNLLFCKGDAVEISYAKSDSQSSKMETFSNSLQSSQYKKLLA